MRIRSSAAVISICIFIFVFLSAGFCRAETYNPLKHMWYGTRDIPDKYDAIVFGVGSLATLGALFADHPVHKYFLERDRLGGYEKIGNFWGEGYAEGAIGAATLTIGLIWSRKHEVNAGEAHLEALVANAIYTTVLKYTIRRERPYGGTYTSFPSGHTSTSFTTAGSLMAMYGPIAGVPAIAMGVFTALSRIDSNVHWLSDTIFGATLGLIVGHAYAQHHQHQYKKTKKVAVIPYFDSRKDFGLTAQMRF